jgi:hypothetical protein
MTDDLATFLRARLNTDEADARAAFGPHNDDGPEWTEVSSGALSTGYELHGIGDSAITRHMERWDPKRVLAEVDAKRRILKVHFRRRSYDWDEPGVKGFECAQCCDRYPCQTLRLLALPEAGHPDYLPRWVPDA